MGKIEIIARRLEGGDFTLSVDDIVEVSKIAMEILETADDIVADDKSMVKTLVNLIKIGNITYNYTDRDTLPIDDGVYDQLVAKLMNIDYDKFKSCTAPVQINVTNVRGDLEKKGQEFTKPFIMMNKDDKERYRNAFYPEIFTMNKPYDPKAYMTSPFQRTGKVTKRLRDTSHNHPDLVGTLEKCKFVLNKQAEDLGVLESANVRILERDFFVPLIQRGIIPQEYPIQMIGTLKYDGVSIEADVTDVVVSARTRGDTDNNIASDLTPIFEGYKFPNAEKLEKPIGVKFEAIILKDDLSRLNEEFGTSYINGRTAVIGLLGSSDARRFRDYITLVPLQADFGDGTVVDRLTEIEFLNKYYANREYLRYVEFNDCYSRLLFRIKTYVEEAEFFRKFMNFMYDGVVVEFLDPVVRETLGRKNSINQWAMAIKFNPLKATTMFLGWTYTVGQNGVVTPMLHYQPVEFLGSIHTKSTGSSYKRFQDLDLYVGDLIEVTYVNDVMPYVTKPDLPHNRQNHMRPPSEAEMFPTICPCCGEPLFESESGKIRYCVNFNCGERSKQRVANMLKKLGIKDFAESTVELLGDCTLIKLMTMKPDDFEVLGPTNKYKIYEQLQNLKAFPLPVNRVIGALGFSNIADKKWKLIFSKYTLEEFYHVLTTPVYDVRSELASIQGIGGITADTIIEEFPMFKLDIEFILHSKMYMNLPKIEQDQKLYKIRMTGFRDKELAAALEAFPFVDCDPDASVTKDTTILLVPIAGHSSTKTAKAEKYGVQVVPVIDFLEHAQEYIPELVGWNGVD